MKALSLNQPWATLIAIGAKCIETRSWRTNYRGRLAIHAGRRWTREQQALAYHSEPFRTILAEAGKIPTQSGGHVIRKGRRRMVAEDLPRGCIIAVCNLVDCVRITPTFELPRERALCEPAFGDYRMWRFAWTLEAVEPLADPIPLKGRLGIFEIDDALLSQRTFLETSHAEHDRETTTIDGSRGNAQGAGQDTGARESEAAADHGSARLSRGGSS